MKTNFILGKKQIVLASLVVILGAAVYLNWQFASSDAGLEVTDEVNGTVASSQPVAADSSGNNVQFTAIGDPVTTEPVADPTATQPTNTPATDDEAATANTAAEPGTEADVLDTNASQPTEDTGVPTADQSGENDQKMLGDAQYVNSKAIVDENYFVMAQLARTRSRDEALETVATILDNTNLTETDKAEASTKALALSDVIETESRIENLVKAKGFEYCMAYITDNSANIVVKTDGLTQDQATQIKNIVVAEGKIKGEYVSITEIA